MEAAVLWWVVVGGDAGRAGRIAGGVDSSNHSTKTARGTT